MVSATRKSVLAVIHAPGWGGLHTLVERIGPTCRAMGYDWTIVIPQESDPKAVERLRATGLEVIQIPLRRIRKSKSIAVQLRFLLSVPVDVFRLNRIIRRRRIDIVQPAGLIHFHSAVAARLAGVPVVWQLHSDQPPMMLRRIFVPWVVRLASAVMTSGSGLVAAHPGLERIADRIYPFRAPIDTDRFRPDPAARIAARQALQVQPDDIVVGTVGGWGPNKNHGLLVQAVALARQTEPRLKLRILGFPYDQHLRWYAENVEEPARRLGAGVVEFLQPGQRVDHFMNGFDIFCLPSRGEGASLVVGEAMGTGLPVIANAVGALPDSVLDGQTGLLNHSLTAEEMARHILALAADPDRRQAMGTAGRAFCIEKMSYAACARAHVDAYEAAERNAGAARHR